MIIRFISANNAFVDTLSIALTLNSACKAKQFIDDLEHYVTEKLRLLR